MSDVFGDYGRYYDLLYADKDYRGEAKYVHELLQRFAQQPKSILEFGCGTGKHARLLAEMGYGVTGIERSAEMAEEAEEAGSREQGAGSGKRKARSKERGAESGEPGNASPEAAEPQLGRTGLPTRLDGSGEPSYNAPTTAAEGSFRCLLGDIRTTDLGQTFDAVISLFHVVSYQTSEEDLTATFQNAARHLQPDGLFLFDVWYGPAVLSQRPVVRVKRVEDEQVYVTRIAEPTLLPNQNCVRVDYTLFAQRFIDGHIDRCTESHLMRYFTTPEIRTLADRCGFDLAATEEWLTGQEPTTDTWGVCYVLRKRAASGE